MQKIVIVGDDKASRELLQETLKPNYEVIDTSDWTEALTLILHHKPDCILLDLTTSKITDFELCQTLSSLSATRLIPIIVLSSSSSKEYKDYCLHLGAREFLEKPVDPVRLRLSLFDALKSKQPERRSEIRARLRVSLRVSGVDAAGKSFDSEVVTEDVSPSGFSCAYGERLEAGSIVQIVLKGGGSDYKVGKARITRIEGQRTAKQLYGFRFIDKPTEWILR